MSISTLTPGSSALLAHLNYDTAPGPCRDKYEVYECCVAIVLDPSEVGYDAIRLVIVCDIWLVDLSVV
jgi:hypothetical protein